MAKIIGLHPQDVAISPFVLGQAPIITPGMGAPQSVYPIQSFTTTGAGRMRYGENFRVAERMSPFDRGIIIEDSAVRGSGLRSYWKFNQFPNQNLTVPLQIYSCRFYFSCASNNFIAGQFPHLITFMNGGIPPKETTLGNANQNGDPTAATPVPGDRWSLMLRDYNIFTTAFNRPYIANYNGGAVSSDGATNLNNTTTWRVEIQVNNSLNPKVTVKIYNWDSETPTTTITGNPSDVRADAFMLGRHPTKSGDNGALAFIPLMWIGDLDIFDTYDLDGTVGKHYRKRVDRWSEIVNGVEVQVFEEGVVVDGALVLSDRQNFTDRVTAQNADGTGSLAPSRGRDFVNNNFTLQDPIQYQQGVPQRIMALYTPNGTPPANGWPVVMWIHGGFFSGGSRRGVDAGGWSEGWAKFLLHNGYAVSTIDYVTSTAFFNNNAPAWPNAGSGKFPSFLVCAKLAAKFLSDNAATYNLNGSRIAMCGHSAGGYIALCSALSRDLTNLNGRNLTVSNTTFSGIAGATDIPIKCVYAWAAPTDMLWAYENDIELQYPFPIVNFPRIRATANSYMGLVYNQNLTEAQIDGARVADIVNAQTASKIPPVGLVYSTGDGLIRDEHLTRLRDALISKSIAPDVIITAADHDYAFIQSPENHFLQFLINSGMKS